MASNAAALSTAGSCFHQSIAKLVTPRQVIHIGCLDVLSPLISVARMHKVFYTLHNASENSQSIDVSLFTSFEHLTRALAEAFKFADAKCLSSD